MSTQPLFLDAPLSFEGEEKIAGMLTRLGDNVDNWQQEIVQEAYKQLPYLSDFEVHVILDKVDEERGYAFGSIEVSPKSSMTVEELNDSGLSKVHIPIVVKEQMLSPLDVFLCGKKYSHLTEARLREALFRAETFDAARSRPHDPSLVHDLQPPLRAGYGGFGSGGVKLGSSLELEHVPLLPLLHGRVKEAHVERLKGAISEPSVWAKVAGCSEGTRAAFASAVNLTPSNLEKSASHVAGSIRPTVVQLRKLGTDRVMVKWASDEMFSPQEEEIPMAAAQDMLGDEDLTAELEGDGTVTMSPDSSIKQTLEAEEVKVADSFGLWKVQQTTGETMIGWVFPQVLDLDLNVLPLSLFNNGSQHALQENIAGEPAGKSLDIPKCVPRGYGALYYTDHGTAKAFVPMTISSSMRDPGGLKFMGQTDLGDQVTFSFAEGLKKPVRAGESEWVLPNYFNWMPLRGKTELVDEPALFSKLGSANRTGTVDIVGDSSGTYSFRGPAIAKVAQQHTKFVDRDKALFLGVALGMQEGFCKQALDRARLGERVSVAGLKVLGSLKEKMASIKANLRKELAELDPPIHNYFLAKEASVLDDALTADKILGLGFLNAENISTFIDLLPALQAASCKLAELLVAVRIGLKEVPEVAVERMLVALEDVIRGLKSLQQKELNFSN